MHGLVKIYVLVTNSTKHVSDNAALFIKMYIRRSASMQMYCNINYGAIRTFLHMLWPTIVVFLSANECSCKFVGF